MSMFRRTKAKRQTIRIDGETYELINPDEFLLDALKTLDVTCDTLEKSTDVDTVMKAVDDFIALVAPDIPPEVRGRLRIGDVRQIADVYLKLARRKC